MSPKLRFIAEQYKLSYDETMTIARCLFSPSYAGEILDDGNYVVCSYDNGNKIVGFGFALVLLFTAQFRK